ncbi:MAG: hypothetical protein NT135_01755 [Candidatus Berkelbacteria bacterium]|nr:hypothetical protein [Candidatus Berkelbacteria bacterium]
MEGIEGERSPGMDMEIRETISTRERNHPPELIIEEDSILLDMISNPGSLESIKDDDGRVVREVIKNADGIVLTNKEIIYNSDGEKQQEVVRDLQGKILETYEYHYNGSSQLTERTRKNAEGKTTSTIKHEYDSRGLLARKTEYNSEGNVKANGFGSMEFKYDAHGREIQKIYHTEMGRVWMVIDYDRGKNGEITVWTVRGGDGSIWSQGNRSKSA